VKRTDKTLLEQMRISDIEIYHRMELLGLEHNALTQLASLKPLIEENIDFIVDEFYKKQTNVEAIAQLIGDADTLRRLHSAQRKYIIDLFSGYYDTTYVNNRLRIGMVHKRIGVEPKLYLSAVSTLKEIIVKTLTKSIKKNDLLSQAITTLDKLLYFDTTLIFDTYIDSLVGEIESAKKQTEIYATSLEIKVAERTKQLEELTKIDPLTNIYNRRAMQDILRREIAVAIRRHTILSLAYFDVDNFKNINDTQGHIEGDNVLSTIGQALLNTVRECDVPCRYGGDEFCLILPECELNNAKLVCEKLIQSFTRTYPDFSLSIGIAATGPEKFIDGDQLIKQADKKMYLAKKKNGCQIKL